MKLIKLLKSSQINQIRNFIGWGGGISRVIFHQGGSEIIYSPPPWGYENLPPAAGYITPSLLKKNQSTSPDFNDNVWVDAKSHEISKKSYE